jgi:hypothetical protein
MEVKPARAALVPPPDWKLGAHSPHTESAPQYCAAGAQYTEGSIAIIISWIMEKN